MSSLSSYLLAALLLALVSAQQVKKESLEFLFGVFREDCFYLFFTKYDFTNAECLKITISKLLGYLIITGALVLKVPQIIKIVRA
jgi:hypothetical protein